MHGTRLAPVDFRGAHVPAPIVPMPIRPLSVLTALLHVLIALRLVPALAALPVLWPLAALTVLALAASAATIPLPFLSRRRGRSSPGADVLKWVGLIGMGWF